MANVFDVAAYILEKQGAITAMKLQKLVYYSQAWSLVWDEKPIFPEDIEAWANGPVVRGLFNAHRGQYTVSTIDNGSSDNLSQIEKETVDAVLKYYGDKPSQWLSDLTHMEDPWKNARAGMSDNSRGSKAIQHSDIADYYSSLLPDSK